MLAVVGLTAKDCCYSRPDVRCTLVERIDHLN
jgi:hypothetical protein